MKTVDKVIENVEGMIIVLKRRLDDRKKHPIPDDIKIAYVSKIEGLEYALDEIKTLLN